MPVKHLDAQAAMKMHLSQSVGAGALEGQHGMSPAMASVMDVGAIWSGACIDRSEEVDAITGRDSGAIARPAIIKIASSLRMAEAIFTNLISHKLAAKQSCRFEQLKQPPALISIKPTAFGSCPYLSERPMTAISSVILARWSALSPLAIACSTQCDT
jgi:hypothetical protein